ncbi:MAG: serine hydrolase domain-containing protein [Alphaproteobacteria bacterium]|nr:serine hydrolase domain-containing protein [Alphaproteobacteria bacterium]
MSNTMYRQTVYRQTAYRPTARMWMVAASAIMLAAACGNEAPAPAPTEIAAVAAKPSDARAWPAAAVADPTTLGFTVEGLAALDAAMAKSVADQDVAGMVTMLVRNGDVAQFNTYGVQSGEAPMTKDTMFRIYSMSKPVTGVALMQLFEQGKWQLDDPVTKHAPELASLKLMTGVDKAGKAILADPSRPPTMREIMTHTAGFGYGLAGNDPVNEAFRDQAVLGSPNLEEMMTKVAGIPLLFEPGTRWSYSVSVDIQGYLVQKLSGQKFGEYLKANLFTPLGMDDTSFFVTEANKARFADVYSWDEKTSKIVANPERPDRPGFTDPNRLESGGGGLVSTIHDYARFCQMMLNKGELGGNRVLKPETIAIMTSNHIGDLRLYSDGTTANPGLPGVGFGMDYAIYTDPAAANVPNGVGTYYWGGAAGTWFWIDPANDLFFIGMIQRMGPARPDGMNFRGDSAKLVYAALQGAAPAAAVSPAPTPAQ